MNKLLKFGLLLSWLCVIWGALYLVGALWGTWYTISFVSHSVVADAVISDIGEEQDSKGNKTYAPIATYTVSNGDGYRTVPHEPEYMSSPYAEIGQHVRVLYDKASPSNGMIYSSVEFWGSVGKLGLDGAMRCALGVMGIWLIDLRRKKFRDGLPDLLLESSKADSLRE